MKKQKIVFAIVIGIIIFSLKIFAQDTTKVAVKNMATPEEIKEEIKKEGHALISILEELEYLQRILEKKVLIKALEKQNDQDEIIRIFRQDEKHLKDFLEHDQLAEAKNFLNELKLAYKNIDLITPYLLYYEGKYQLLKHELTNAQLLLEELIEDYPNFEYLNDTIVMLQEIYFRLGLHKDFISIYNKSTNVHRNVEKFWLGHSYYGLGDYEKARKIFVNLQKDKNFGIRAQEMVALISLYTNGIETAINNFHNLENKIRKSKKYYFFIPLTLARLYSLKGDENKSLAYYDYYVDYMTKHNYTIPDDIIFEIAVQNKNAKRYKKALAYFKYIINKPVRSEYYSSARLLAAITEQESGNFEQIETGLNEVIKNKDILEKTLEAKFKLLDKYDKLRKKIKMKNLSPEERKTLTEKLDSIERVLLSTNKTISNFYTGKDPQSVAMIRILEQEYLYYNVTLDMMDAVVELANTVPNKRVPKLIERSIAAEDSSIVTLQMLKYLGHKRQITAEDIKIARSIIEEKKFENKLLKVWQKIYKFSQEHNKDRVKEIASRSILLVQENIKDLDKIAKMIFNGEPSPALSKRIDDELNAIRKNKKELEELKKVVIEKFNKRIAKRLENQKEVLENEQIHLKDFYQRILSKLVKEVKEEKAKNQFTLLDILYKQTKVLDIEYKNISKQSKQEKKKNE